MKPIYVHFGIFVAEDNLTEGLAPSSGDNLWEGLFKWTVDNRVL